MSKIGVMVNTCYGGFHLSKEAMHEYKRRKAMNEGSANPSEAGEGEQEPGWGVEIERHDQLMVQIVREMGAKACGFYSKITIEDIPSHFANYYKINEYDGTESLQIDYDAYIIDMAKEALKDGNLTKTEKISRAYAILNSKNDYKD